MSKKDVEQDLDEVLKAKSRVFVLFYASWCPFSQKFLPVYEKCTLNSPTPCLRVMVDDEKELCDKYSIDYFPTVLLFENGKVAKRLEAEPGTGVDKKQLNNMLLSTDQR